jgi:hypothetical protein
MPRINLAANSQANPDPIGALTIQSVAVTINSRLACISSLQPIDELPPRSATMTATI